MVGALAPRSDPHLAYDPPEKQERVDDLAAQALEVMKRTGRDRTEPRRYFRTWWQAYGARYVGDPARAGHAAGRARQQGFTGTTTENRIAFRVPEIIVLNTIM